MAWTFYNSSGEALTNFGPVTLTDLDIDGGTDIGEAIVDADLFIIDNGAGGTNVKTAASRIVTYVDANASGSAKVWCKINAAGALQTGDYNVASVTDSGTGDRTIVFDTDFANTNYVPLSHAFASTTLNIHPEHPVASFAAGSVDLNMYETESNALDDRESTTVVFGDQ